jgi:glycosyltransferase involved in cell wall biosynthesis
MKFSIITPTHLQNHYLSELHNSLQEQTHADWEWVIVLNNHGERKLHNDIQSDSRVKVMKTLNHNDSIGYLKKFAADHAVGEVIVEVDHDDLLTPNALAELQQAFLDKTIDFAYSDSIYLSDEFIPYNPRFGWTHEKVMYNGQERYTMHSFEPSSRSMCFIWYCPNHVRAWRKEFYQRIGGHDESYEVCDDHEILIRTYLEGKIKKISKPLYVYRITGDNTWLQKNQMVQEKTVELFHQHAYQLAEREARLKNLQVISLDQFDLNQPLPFKNNSVGVVYANQILKDYDRPFERMSEIYRVLADCGWTFIQVPSTDGRGAFQDPFTKSHWNENSFLYYTQQMYANFIRNQSVKFQSWRLDTEWWPNSVAMTNAWLTAIKSNARRPHTVEI